MSASGRAIVKVDFNKIAEYQMYLNHLQMQMESAIYGMQEVNMKLYEMIDFTKSPPSGPTGEYDVSSKYIREMEKVLNSIYDMQYAASRYVEYYHSLGVLEYGNLVYDEATVDKVLTNFENIIYEGDWSSSLSTNSFGFELWENGILAGLDCLDSERERAVRYNKKILDDLNEDLSSMKNNLIGYTDELRDRNHVYKMNLKPLVDGVAVNSILEAFDIEDIDYQMLKAETEALASIQAKLGNTSEEQLADIKKMYKDLVDDELLDNFLINCKKQIAIIGFDNFMSDPKRIAWLANNPRYEVNNFHSNLTPEQLRLLTEEVSYMLFHNDGNRKKPYFRQDVYKLLINGDGTFIFNQNTTNPITMDIKKHFTNARLTFKEVASPSGETPWYIQENGLEACVMRVNGEIVVMYPGSQELKQDWIDTDVTPNLKHEVPSQYQIASDFAAEVKAAYPDDNIILCGHSLGGGAVSYAGAENDLNSFAIDPAPSTEGVGHPDYDKGITIVPGGKFGGILNGREIDEDGYYKSATDIDIADFLSQTPKTLTIPISSVAGATAGFVTADDGVISKTVGTIKGGNSGMFVGNHLKEINKYIQANDTPSSKEAVYKNSVNEKSDSDSVNNPGYRDLFVGYGGDHMTGKLDDGLIYGYTPYS